MFYILRQVSAELKVSFLGSLNTFNTNEDKETKSKRKEDTDSSNLNRLIQIDI